MTSSRVTLEYVCRHDRLQLIATSSNDIAETCALATQAKNKLAAAQTKMERSMLNITYRDRKTNMWEREKTKVTHVIEQVRRRKWTWAGHVGRIRDNRRTLHITHHLENLRKEEEDRRDVRETN